MGFFKIWQCKKIKNNQPIERVLYSCYQKVTSYFSHVMVPNSPVCLLGCLEAGIVYMMQSCTLL